MTFDEIWASFVSACFAAELAGTILDGAVGIVAATIGTISF